MPSAPSDRQPPTDNPHVPRWTVDIKNLLPSIAVVAAVWYTLLIFSYDQFYRRLTVSLPDVGLTYSAILANSAGTAFAIALALVGLDLLVLVALLLVLGILWILGRLVLKRTGLPARQPALRIDFRSLASWRRARWILAIDVLCALLIAVIALPHLSTLAFERVKRGEAVLPPRLPLANSTLLPIHADPVVIEPNDEKALQSIRLDRQSADNKSPSHYLYLGQSNGEVVIYDSAQQRVLYIPSSDVLLSITNCHIRRPIKAVCSNAPSVIPPFAKW
jgi:hypothetical protein